MSSPEVKSWVALPSRVSYRLPVPSEEPLQKAAHAADIFRGGGEMGALLRATDWSRTSVGPVERWPQSLRTALSIVLSSRFGMYIAWGRDYTQFYNDAYRPILGSSKHPAAGKLSSETFAESWHIIGPLFERVMRGEAVGSEDWMLPLDRNGYLEECFFTFCYSPIRDESGEPGGVLVTVTETTSRAIGERRLATLRALAMRTVGARTATDAWSGAAAALAGNPADVPFALLYSLEGNTARRVAAVNLDAASPAAPETIQLHAAQEPGWPLAEAARSGREVLVQDVQQRFGELRGPAWPEPVESALVLPLTRQNQPRPYGFAVLGISPRRALDDAYRSFLQLSIDPVVTAIAGVRAQEAAIDQQKAESARLEALFVQSPVAVAVLRGPGHRFEITNSLYDQIAGRRAVGLTIREAFPELAGQGIYELLDGVYTSGKPFVGKEIPLRYDRRGDGRVTDAWLDFTYQPLRDATGAVSGVMAVVVDVTEQVEARRLLRISEERFRMMSETIPQQVWTSRPDGQLDFVNSRVTTYFGRTAGEMIGNGWQGLVHDEDLPRTIERWVRSLTTGEPYENEFRLRRASDGLYRWNLAQALCTRDAAGNIDKWFGSNTDIHDRKETEKVREQLILALERSNAELDQFAYVASHDLKAPLRGIANLSEWLEEDLGEAVTGPARDKLVKLRGRVHRMEALIDGILDYSRAGRQRHKPERVEVSRLLQEVQELLAPRPGVRISLAAAMPVLHTEKVPLQQVFLNLVGNAIKHARRDDAQINVRVADQADFFRFTVTDNGQGIAPEYHERIWGIFQTLEGRDKVEGAGIGLSVVRKIVESRGGAAWVESAAGAGAAFHFTWPREERLERP
jgi:PAS domain S-box-containing protein